MGDPTDPCRFVDLRKEWGTSLLWRHGHRLHECSPDCPEVVFVHSENSESLHRCGPYCSGFQGPMERISRPPNNPAVYQFDLGRCPRCRKSTVQRCWGIVEVRGRSVAVQIHDCVNCWTEVSRYTDPL